MKVYEKEPVEEVIIRKLDNGEYEWYLITPRLIETGRKLGNMRFEVGGTVYSSLTTATDVICKEHGLKKFVGDRRGGVPTHHAKRKVAGTTLLDAGTWHRFCAMRSIRPGDVQAIQREYYLTAAEADELGHQETTQAAARKSAAE
jgi:hypothetical protein